jgi:hypothetical protein
MGGVQRGDIRKHEEKRKGDGVVGTEEMRL